MIDRTRNNDLSDTLARFARAKAEYKQRQYPDVDNAYRMAKATRLTRSVDRPSAADHHYASEYDYFRGVEIARSLDRDDLIAGAVVDRFVRNVIQSGFMLDPKSGNRDVDEILKTRWNAWASSPAESDIQGQMSFNAMTNVVLRDMIVSGDIFALPLASGAVQLVENHRCRTPRDLPGDERRMTIHGVRVDGARRRLDYFFTKDDVSLYDFPELEKVQRVRAYAPDGTPNVIHLYHPKRISQTRGVTKFAPVTGACAMHDDIQYGKLVQQQVVSAFGIIRERELGFELPDNVTEDVSYVDDPCAAGQTRAIRDISAGMWYTGYPGEKIKGFSSNVPNPTFFDHAKQVQQLISINLDVPLILLLLDGSETNFSGWRGAVDQAHLSFKAFQRWLADIWNRRLHAWKFRQWSDPRSPLADPLIVEIRAAGYDVFSHEWIYPTWPYIEPLKDASAQLLRMRNGLTSPRRIQAENGADWDVVSTEMVEDAATLIDKALEKAAELNAKYPDNATPISWRDCAMLPTPDGVQLSMSQLIGEDQSEPSGAPDDAE